MSLFFGFGSPEESRPQPVHRFASDEAEVEWPYGYPNGYKVKSIDYQIRRLYEAFPRCIVKFDQRIASRPLPDHAEGWFAIPEWQMLAKTYTKAVRRVFDMIHLTQDGKFYNLRDGDLIEYHFRQHKHSVAMMNRLRDQEDDPGVFIIPAQFGLFHKERSVHRVREKLGNSEFGLGAFAVAIMLFTHPERLVHRNDLGVVCPGDEYFYVLRGAPRFRIYNSIQNIDRVEFDTTLIDKATIGCGSATGFLL